MSIQLVKGDITELNVDAIVNAANTSLLGGGGVDGAIHRKAGKELRQECLLLGGCNVGEAKITKGYQLKAKHIIHTVGPYWKGGIIDEKEQLANCYINSLQLLIQNQLTSIAFPCISTGAYLFPKELASQIAIKETQNFLLLNPHIEITFCCFEETDYTLYQNILNPRKSWTQQIKNIFYK